MIDAPSLTKSQIIAQNILGEINWLNETEGYVTCPGMGGHNSPDGSKDCILYLDRVPTLNCFHSSCGDALIQKNRELRQAILNEPSGGLEPKRLTAEQKKYQQEIKRKESIRRQTQSSRDRVLTKFAWPYASILTASPVKLDGKEDQHGKMLVALYHPDDVIWIGNTYDSGQLRNTSNFQTREGWLKLDRIDVGQFICPATFKSGSYSRGNENIADRRFLVVESDELNKDQVGAIFRWLKDAVGLKLRAIVDTAGKSLHAWFVYPKIEIVEDLKLVLPQLGCDPKLFTASQPVRLPGVLRDGKYQKLVYLESEVQP